MFVWEKCENLILFQLRFVHTVLIWLNHTRYTSITVPNCCEVVDFGWWRWRWREWLLLSNPKAFYLHPKCPDYTNYSHSLPSYLGVCTTRRTIVQKDMSNYNQTCWRDILPSSTAKWIIKHYFNNYTINGDIQIINIIITPGLSAYFSLCPCDTVPVCC